MDKLDWFSEESHLFCNPRLADSERVQAHLLFEHFSHLKGHIWISTSGSTGSAKWAALSKQAILASAVAVNQHLQITERDCWLHALPDWHVGGIGIWARTYLSRSRVIKENSSKWNAHAFCEAVNENQATLSALVPTQIYDLVLNKLKSPSSLRAIVVGGGALEEALYHQAVELGWKLVPSYGLTEACSQVATAELGCWEKSEFPNLLSLSHVEITVRDQCLCIKGPSLLTGYGFYDSGQPVFIDPKQNGWFETEDLGQISGRHLKILGRLGDIVKVGGENVDLARLNQLLDKIKLKQGLRMDTALFAMPDQRLGNTIQLAVTETLSKEFIDFFQNGVLPFERIRKEHLVVSIPRTALGKLKRHELLKIIDYGSQLPNPKE